MKNKILTIISYSIILSLVFPSLVLASQPAAYVIPNSDYIAVRTDVFNKLVTNDKLADLYKSESNRKDTVISTLKSEYDKKDINFKKQTETLQQIISNDKDIIVTKDDNIKKYETLYNNEKQDKKEYRNQTILYKILFVTAAGLAISKMDSTGWKIAAGLGTGAIALANIRF
jgi:hypothetical protein